MRSNWMCPPLLVPCYWATLDKCEVWCPLKYATQVSRHNLKPPHHQQHQWTRWSHTVEEILSLAIFTLSFFLLVIICTFSNHSHCSLVLSLLFYFQICCQTNRKDMGVCLHSSSSPTKSLQASNPRREMLESLLHQPHETMFEHLCNSLRHPEQWPTWKFSLPHWNEIFDSSALFLDVVKESVMLHHHK